MFTRTTLPGAVHVAPRPTSLSGIRRPLPLRRHLRPLRANEIQEQEKIESPTEESEVEQITKKWGLEAGIFKVGISLSKSFQDIVCFQAMTGKKEDGSKSGSETAKELLKKYGSAYLITSISFAIVSYIICYFLVDIGVDVTALLAKIGIKATGTSEKVGTDQVISKSGAKMCF